MGSLLKMNDYDINKLIKTLKHFSTEIDDGKIIINIIVGEMMNTDLRDCFNNKANENPDT